ncbi:MAG: efflux RND transporter periplasmic adaptor subunit [Verrucomicrobia bacterium]|nr:efflux RND transporter periplasmic adaptor subunit [Verrucomicrobiota bacterium]
MMRSILIGTTLVLILASGLAIGCQKSPFAGNDPANPETQNPAVPVEVAPVVRGAIESTVKSARALEAEEEVKVYSRTANRVTKLRVEEGDSVEKGRVLLQLDDDIQQTQYKKAQVRFEKAKQEYERQKPLFEQNLISEQAFKEAQFEQKQLELALEDARRDLDYTEVRAPISGIVTARRVNLGDLVNLNQHLFDIIDFNSIVARLYVPEQELSHLTIGQPARVATTALKGETFEGFIKRIAPVVESKTGTVKVTIAFKDVGPLRPGMYVDVEIVTTKRTDAILLSKRSMVYDGERMFVFRLGPDRTVERLLVVPKIVDNLNVEPVSGFNEGDLIVVAGQSGLKDGARVRLPDDPDPSKEAETTAPHLTSAD